MNERELKIRNILAKLPHATDMEIGIICGVTNGCDIVGWFDAKQELIYETAKALSQLYYEDVEFMRDFVIGYAQKKGLLKDQESKEVTA